MSIERSPDSRNSPAGFLYETRQARVVTPIADAGQQDSPAAQVLGNAQLPETQEAAPDLDLSFLELPTQTAEAVNAVSDAPEQTEMTDAEVETFKKQFKKVFGLDADVAAQQFQELSTFRAQQGVQQQLSALTQAWGVTPDVVAERLKEVTARFSKYPTQLQAQLDNPEGAQLIWAKLQQEKQGQQSNVKTPTLDRSTSQKATSKVGQPQMVKQSDIDKLSPTEYAQNADKIAALYAQNLVLKGQ